VTKNKKLIKIALALSFLAIILIISQKNSPTPIRKNYQINSYTHQILLPAKIVKNDNLKKYSFLTGNYYGHKVKIYLAKPLEKIQNHYLLTLPNLKDGQYHLGSNITLTIGYQNYPTINSIKVCQGKNENLNCFASYFINQYILNNNLRATLTEVKERKDTTPGLANYCHLVLHQLGIYYIIKGGQLGNFDSAYVALCDNGFIHGAQEGLSIALSTPELFHTLPKICTSSSILSTIGNCDHGLGHLAYWRTGNFSDAINLCLALEPPHPNTQNTNSLINCTDGVAMSYLSDYQASKANPLPINSYEIPLKVKNPISLCLSLKDFFAATGCLSDINFFYQAQDTLILKNGCDKLTPLQQSYCYISLGRLSGNYYPYTYTGKICNTTNKDALNRCLAQGVAWNYFMYKGNPDYTSNYCREYSTLPATCAFLKEREKNFTV